MSSLNIFCFGFGQVAKTFIQKLKLENFNINLSTTSRKKTQTLKFDNINYTSFQFEGDDYDIELIKNLEKSDHILVSIPPREGTDLVIKNFSNIIENCNAKWITYLSATSVYGDHKGEWVNEESKTKPITSNCIDRLSAEKLWLSLNLNKKIPLQIFRLSGIYSNESNILARLKYGKAKIVNRKKYAHRQRSGFHRGFYITSPIFYCILHDCLTLLFFVYSSYFILLFFCCCSLPYFPQTVFYILFTMVALIIIISLSELIFWHGIDKKKNTKI